MVTRKDHPHKGKSIERLQRALSTIADLRQTNYDSPDFDKWDRNTQVAIENTFGSQSRHIRDFTQIKFTPISISWSADRDRQLQEAHIAGLSSAASVLESMIQEIEEYWDDDDQPAPPSSMKTSERETTNEVFVVHGRDNGAKDAVARFLTNLGLQPIVLHEQPNQGRTIIEKFEDYARVGYAVVLLTPDDKCVSETGDCTFRARQNVILELGYFIGQLGRKHTCALLKGDVEIPSDYDGVLYVKMDDGGGWKAQLVGELKEAQFDIDANRMYE